MDDLLAVNTDHGPTRFRDPLDGGSWNERLNWMAGRWRPDAGLVDTFRRAHFEGDARADALVEWMHATGMRESMTMFDQALEHGVRSVPNAPEPLRAFIEEIEAVPSWLNRGAIVRACRIPRRAALGHTYVLFSVSLLAGYASAGITKALVGTGELERMAPRRLAETNKFVNDVYDSGTMERSSDGFKSTIRVRIMHAFVRRKLLRGGWDVARWGIPINQADMAATVLSFSISYMIGLRALGYIIPKRDRAAMVHLWRYMGRLLGVNDTLLAATEAEAIRLLWLVAVTQEGPDQDGRALAQALLAVPSAYRGEGRFGRVLERFDRAFCGGLARYFVGDEAADTLGIPNNLWKLGCFVVAPFNLCLEAIGKIVPGVGGLSTKLGLSLNAYRAEYLRGPKPVSFVPRAITNDAE